MSIYKFQHEIVMGKSMGICGNLGDEKVIQRYVHSLVEIRIYFVLMISNVVKYTFNFLY